MIIGFIPVIVSIFYAYNAYGSEAFLELFDFARRKSMGGNLFKGLFYYPIILIILSYPSGLISIFGFIRVNQYKNLKLRYLLSIFPLVILFALMVASTALSHYALMLIPWIAIASGIAIDSLISSELLKSYQFKKLCAYIFLLIGLSLMVILLFKITGLVSIDVLDKPIIISSFFVVSLVNISAGLVGIRGLNNHRNFSISIGLMVITQTILLTILYGIGILGNPNQEIKTFVREPFVNEILRSNTVYLIGVNRNTKVRTLMEFYLPNYQDYQKSLDQVKGNSYFMVSKDALLELLKFKKYSINKIAKYKEFFFIRVN